MSIPPESDIVKAFKSNNTRVIQQFYSNNYKKVEAMILRNNGMPVDAKDIYQEAFIALWKNVLNNNYKPKSEASIEAYLYQIAKFKWLDVLKSSEKKKTVYTNDIIDGRTNSKNVNELIELEKKYNLVEEAFIHLGNNCQKVLTDFYIKRKSMAEIANEQGITINSAKNKKYRCLQQLREKALNLNERYEGD